MRNARPLLRMPGVSPPQAEGGCDITGQRLLVTNPRNCCRTRRPFSSRSRFTTSTRGRDIQISGGQIKSSAYKLRATFCLQIAPRNASLHTCARHAEVRTCDVRLPWQSIASVVRSIWVLLYPAHFSVHTSQTASLIDVEGKTQG